MLGEQSLLAWAESLRTLDYYKVMGVDREASPREIKGAFYALSLRCHPDRYAGEPQKVVSAAAEVFKRVVEAYGVLSKAPLRARYDAALARGKIRMDAQAPPTPPPAPTQRTLEAIARTPRAKAFALKADRLLSIGRLEDARIQLTSALQHEPDNAELEERIALLYEAMALEPP